jgi:hypothetical protein
LEFEVRKVLIECVRFVRSREWPPKSSPGVRSVLGGAVGLIGVGSGIVRLDPLGLLVGLAMIVITVALWPKQPPERSDRGRTDGR